MNLFSARKPLTSNLSKWSVALLALAAGWLIGQHSSLQLTSTADAAAGMSPLEKLLAEDEVRNKITLYGLYADGDGTGGKPRDLRSMAYNLMTEDVVSEIYLANGDGPRIFKGREFIANSPPENDLERTKNIAGRHYLVGTVFDDITPSTINTRTTAVYFDVTKNKVGADCAKAGPDACGGLPVKTVIWVYHMTWKKTPQGWQISKNILRDDN